jgi:CspA family cold shock protein
VATVAAADLYLCFFEQTDVPVADTLVDAWPHAGAFASASIVARSTPRERRRESDVTGTVRTLRTEKGFGFIKDEAGQEYFFHQSAIYGEGIADLREGDGVTFDVGDAGPKGPRAENVRRTST